MPVTQKDIALEAGVSQMTVSDVLQNRPRGRVKPETRQRILDVACRLGYQPNIAAQALRSRQSRIIAYVTSQDADRQYHALSEHLISGLARALCADGYRLLIESAPSREVEPQVIQKLINAGMCDGFVIRSFEAKDAAWEALAISAALSL
jgi:DNA-binding LacI/PurR family transcriptional regulator